MGELRDRFERLAAGLAPRLGGAGDVRRRAQRRARNRRIAAGAVAGAIALGGAAAAWTGLRTDVPRPATPRPGPTASPGLRPSPQATPIAIDPHPVTDAELMVQNGTAQVGLAAETATELQKAGHTVVEVGNAARSYTRTTIFHGPGLEGDAAKLQRRFFPGADIQPLSGPSLAEIIVVLGADQVGPRPSEVLQAQAAELVHGFSDARRGGGGADAYLSAFAKRQYRRNDVGTDGEELRLYEQHDGKLPNAFAFSFRSPQIAASMCEQWPVGTCEGATVAILSMWTKQGTQVNEVVWIGRLRDGRVAIRAAMVGLPPGFNSDDVPSTAPPPLDGTGEG